MQRMLVLVALVAALLSVTGAVAGTPSGNGAQKSALSAASNGGNANNCMQGSGSTHNGWAILNKTGKPVPGTSTIQGEIHVVDAALAGQMVMAFLVPASSSMCMSQIMTVITLNREGIGNGHVSGPESNRSYYVTIMQGNNEVLASKAVPLL